MLIDFLKKYSIEYLENVDMSQQTSFRIGGTASILILPDSAEKAAELLSYLKSTNQSYFIMGNGSNLLFSDGIYSTPVIGSRNLQLMHQNDQSFTFGAGVKLYAAANFAAENSYTGLEFAHGIPGSIGGAVYMNAGAYDGSMSQVVYETTFVTPEGKIEKMRATDHNYGYRKSEFSDHPEWMIVQTTLNLQPGDKMSIKNKMNDLMIRRKEKQPLNYPSAGSTFKRPEGAFAGKLIDDCGLRGYSIGGAQVSEKHCGFIINQNHASFSDVLDLIHFVQETVLQKTGYKLECEVKIIK